jgi:hypothetical protein
MVNGPRSDSMDRRAAGQRHSDKESLRAFKLRSHAMPEINKIGWYRNMSAQLQPATIAPPQATEQTEYRGRFKKGPDPRRHVFTKDECSDGFWAAVESIITRYPDAIMSDGRHMVANFMKSRTARTVVN